MVILLVIGCVDALQTVDTPRSYIPATPPPVASVSERVPSWSSGPVPDYSLLEAVYTHRQVAEMVPELPRMLTELIGESHVVADHNWWEQIDRSGTLEVDESVIWMRDYQPIFVREADGSLKELRYLSRNRNRSSFDLPLPGVSAETIPLLHENGNLVATSRYVFMTEKLLEDNGEEDPEPHLKKEGFHARDEDEVLSIMARALRRDRKEIILTPPMPHEATGHVDVFLLPLSDDAIVVPTIDERAMEATAGDSPRRALAEDILAFLDERALQMQQLGLVVVRLPMVAPELEETEEEDGTLDYDLLVFTPANSLLLNFGAKRLALLPSFINNESDPKNVALFAHYADIWKQELRRWGWEPFLVDTSDLVGHLGLLRCVSAVVPSYPQAVHN